MSNRNDEGGWTVALGWVEAGVIGLVQGVSELFPVSSLGHSVLIPALVGGSWARDLSISRPESPYLAFIVGLHVATAIALVVFFRRDWARIIGGLCSSVRDRRVRRADERLAWMLVLATIPVGVVGLLFEHAIRTVLARPVPAAIFLVLNGLLLAAGERLRRRPAAESLRRRLAGVAESTAGADLDAEARAGLLADRRLSRIGYGNAVAIGAAQIGALAAGISRSGATMVAGMGRGLSHEDAARFSFLLATPVILAAGVLKLPDLLGPLGNGIRGPVLFGSVLSGLGAYLSVRFLVRWFRTRTLIPFAVYCVLAGAGSLVVFAVRGTA